MDIKQALQASSREPAGQTLVGDGLAGSGIHRYTASIWLETLLLFTAVADVG